MSTPNAPLTIRDMIEPAIMAAGGWVNTHAHADRAYTLSPDVLEMRRTCTLQQKWDALDALKRNSTEEDFYRRFSMFFENQIAQGVSALATFVDIDPQSEDRAIKAGLRAREHYQDQLTVKFANQHKDYASRNLTYVRAELRAAQVIWRPANFVVLEAK